MSYPPLVKLVFFNGISNDVRSLQSVGTRQWDVGETTFYKKFQKLVGTRQWRVCRQATLPNIDLGVSFYPNAPLARPYI